MSILNMAQLSMILTVAQILTKHLALKGKPSDTQGLGSDVAPVQWPRWWTRLRLADPKPSVGCQCLDQILTTARRLVQPNARKWGRSTFGVENIGKSLLGLHSVRSSVIVRRQLGGSMLGARCGDWKHLMDHVQICSARHAGITISQ